MTEKPVPVLEEWVLLTTAGRLLGITRQRVHILKSRFRTLHRLGEDGDRPIYVIRRTELNEMIGSSHDD